MDRQNPLVKPTLVILAAGAGSRYGGLKQLAPIGPGGETILEYSVYDALRAGFSRVVLVVRRENEPEFRHRLAGGMAARVPLAYVHQGLDDLPDGFVRPPGRARPWGTGHAVLAAEPEIEGPFAVVNADDFYGAQSFAALSGFLRGARAGSSPAMAMVGFRLGTTLTDAGPVSRALCRLDDDSCLREVIELEKVWRRDGRIVGVDAEGVEQSLHEDELVSMNMWGFPKDLFIELGSGFRDFLTRSDQLDDAEFLLPDLVRSLVREKGTQVEVLRGAGAWCGLTFPEDARQVKATISTLVARGRYPKELWA